MLCVFSLPLFHPDILGTIERKKNQAADVKSNRPNRGIVTAVIILGSVLLTTLGLFINGWLNNGLNPTSTPSVDIPLPTDSIKPGKGTITAGGADSNPPYSYLDNGVASGFDNDLLRAVAREMGVNIEFHLSSWEDAQQNLLEGKVDLLSGIPYSQDPDANFEYSNPYTVRDFVYFVRSNSQIRSIEDLQGKRLAIQKGEITPGVILNSNFSGEIIAAETPEQALQWVSSDQCDGALLDPIVGYYFIDLNRMTNLRALNIHLLEGNYGFVVQKGDQQLVEKLNDALFALDSNGEYDRLENKWISVYKQQSTLGQFRFFIYGLIALAALLGLVLLWIWSLRRQIAVQTKELKVSEEKYRQLIENATEGVCVLINGKLVYMNPKAEEIIGIEDTLMYPFDFGQFIHPDDYEMVLNEFQKCTEDENQTAIITFRIIQQNGSQRWINAHARNFKWEPVPAALFFFSDITESRMLEEAVRKSESKFRLLFDKSPIGLFYYNTDLMITDCNDRIAEFLGVPCDLIENKNLNQFADERLMPAFNAVLNQKEGHYEGTFTRSKKIKNDDHYISLHTAPIFNEKHELQGGIGLVEDITGIITSESKLHNLEDRFQKAFLTSPDSINLNRLSDGLYLDVNQGFTDLTGYTREDVIGQTSLEINIWANPEDRARMVKELQSRGEVKNLEANFRMKDGSIRTGLMSVSLTNVNGEDCIISITRDISDRKLAEDAIRESETRYRTIFNTVPVSIWEEDYLKVYDLLAELRASGVKDLSQYMQEHPEFIWSALKAITIKDVNEVTIRMYEAHDKEELFGSLEKLFDQDSFLSFSNELTAIWDHKRTYEGETINRTLDGKRMIVNILINFPDNREDFSSVLVCLADVTERKQAEAALRESENRYKSIFDSVPVSIWEEDFSQVINYLNDIRENGVKDLDLYLRQNPQAVIEAASLIIVKEVNDATMIMYGAKTKEELLYDHHERIFTEQSYDNFRRELIAIWNKRPDFYGETTHRTIDGREISVSVSTNIPPESEGYGRVFVSIEDITERKKAEDQIKRQIKHLASLRAVDMAISASIDLPITLRVLINQAVQQLAVDAASILLYDPKTQMLRFAAGSGFRTKAIEETNLKIGESYAGKAAAERRIVAANDLGTEYSKILTLNLLKEGFTDYIGIPLIAKGEVKGVLELFNHTPLSANTEWMSLVDSMAGQAAIAIDNATLFDEVQQANINLRHAYDATIEGWAQALELRDGETEGHSLRVADLTVKLAELFGIKGDDLVDVRRGALLHDIGKMGIPDYILLKQGPLEADEWEIMRRHPIYAKQFLGEVEFLQAAIEIPYTHHEKWDGSGYPQGLKGEGIPLVGRIFAVVDCWDALRSDRPYRKAWSNGETWSHIKNRAGKDYDPDVVEKFQQLLKSLNLVGESE